MLDYKQPIETGPIPADGADFDVIVVGGGPGGSAAAAFNALNGCKVLLIEKGVWPRDKDLWRCGWRKITVACQRIGCTRSN